MLPPRKPEPLVLGQASDEARHPATALRRYQRPAFICFILCWAVNLALLLLRIDPPAHWRWVEALLIVTAAATTLLTLAQRLPLQNVAGAATVIFALSSGVVLVGILSGIPFGAQTHSTVLGSRLIGVVPWTLPLLWLVILINGRGVARLIMRPWRKTTYYGLYVIALAAGLGVAMELSLEPYAVHVKNYWVWQVPSWVPTWYRIPVFSFLGWFVSAVAILLAATPWLVNKQPVKQPVDYHPVAIWILLNLYFIAGMTTRGFWGGAIFTLVVLGFTVYQAVRGARW